MLASQMLISTLKEAPSDAEISSHVLLLRAGMIKKLVPGVYNYLPLGLRVLNKIENIIREEMDAAGANEILSSAIQPKELWMESGRWQKYGPELMRFTDRHDKEFCLGPTHEEIFTDLARQLIRSPKQLPMNIYQIHTKYRDEVRPRFGLMRGREFIMKDAYSFDKDEAGLEKSYQTMYDTYSKIFTRLGINYQAVLADTGNIGGNGSHQFMALSEVGESNICYCPVCNYAADQEKAPALPQVAQNDEKLLDRSEVETPNCRTIEEVSNFLHVGKDRVVKTLIYKDFQNDEVVAVLVRGDREVNHVKLTNALNTSEHMLELASDDVIRSVGSFHGFVGPVGLKIRIIVDSEVALMKNFVVGANELHYHLINVNFEKDFTGEVIDVRQAVEGDICPVCGKPMKMERGIEVGQIFKLQTKYSVAMNCTYTNEEGKNIPMVMGCYGIGVTRTMAAIVEQYHDDFGIKWPLVIAPYHAVVVPVNSKDETQVSLAKEIYQELRKNKVEAILDDRDAKAGFKFKDWDLMGIPFIIVVGKKSTEGVVEFKLRSTNEKQELTKDEVVNKVVEEVKNI